MINIKKWRPNRALLSRIAAWVGAVSLVAMNFVPMGASATANQITARSATLSTSAISVPDIVTFKFNPGSSATIKSIRFQMCTSPLPSVSCTVPTGGSMGSATAGSQTNGGGAMANAFGSPAYTGSTDVLFNNATGDSFAAANQIVFPVNAITNPSTTNQSFYFRITTYTDTSGTLPAGGQDYGAMAVSTANQVTVNANVQESLTFCVFTGANCAAGGSSVNLGTGTDNVLSTTSVTGGVSKMEASTNAGTGYVITYITTSPGGTGGTACAGSLSSSNDCIADAGSSSVVAPSGGTAIFGINLVANTTALTPAGALGANPSGGVGVAVSPYATADQIAFQAGSTPRTVANTGSAPSVQTNYTVTYAAQAGNTTKPGAYSAIFTWVATGTF